MQIEPLPRFPALFVGTSPTQQLLLSLPFREHTDSDSENNIQRDNKWYRKLNPFSSVFAASVLAGMHHLNIPSGSTVIFLGAGRGLTVSYLSDIVGLTGKIYAVEKDPQYFQDLTRLAESQPNIELILKDANHPDEYESSVVKVDAILSELGANDQPEIIQKNAQHFLDHNGVIISVVDASVSNVQPAELAFSEVVQRMRHLGLKPIEQCTLEPFYRDIACLIARYNPL
ncbi:putative rRNA 2'-O-methyltransferase fibrillarin [Blattamonas nauphoetae]|uniref:rRNA 2'-O-methyltransferase fibrillarin n=1 Tax=Blattamonas nauphoetae TaxID=2049346 RepID=A0ABQ9YF28_9EUKA|nr:putative rRNA 2'-O-methyltransferase fibrillarin [Blattamonas nauphoetae]